MRRLFLSFLGTGFIRPAPGTWGSLAAMPAALLLHILGGPFLLCIGIIVFFGAGVLATAKEIAGSEDHDPSWIVIDEVVGLWIALLPVSFGAWHVGLSPMRLWPGLVAAFLLFRLFDIWKPWLAGRADRQGGAVGVMLDDVWAGVFAAVLVILLAAASHAGFVASVPDQP